LYRGLASPLCGMVLFNAVQFTAYGQAVSLIRSFYPDSGNNLTVKQYALCGAITGVAVSAVESPMDLCNRELPSAFRDIELSYNSQITSSSPGLLKGSTLHTFYQCH
jgi:hypothetical protein